MKRILLIIILLVSFYEATACHQSTVTEVSAVDNGNGTYTYELQVCMGAVEETYGFQLTFNGGNAVSVGTTSLTSPNGTTITSSITSSNVVEWGDYNCTSCPIFWNGSTQLCVNVTVTLDAPITSVDLYGTEQSFGYCSTTATTTSCFTPDYTILIQSDNCGGSISFNFKDAFGNTLLSQTGLTSNGSSYSYAVCGCAETFTINAPARTTGPSQCPAGLCCGSGNGYYEVYDANGNLIVSSTMTGVATETTNVSVCFVLPVELISFNANTLENEIVLEWTTATEINNDYFIIERSSDGVDFTEIGQVSGAGNSSVLKSYKYIDRPHSKGVFYYRLSQIDYDNTSSMSDIVAVEAKKIFGNNKIYPNPASGSINFLVESTMVDLNGEVAVLDISGKVMLSEKITIEKGVNSTSLNVASLPSGIYFTSVKYNGEVIRGRFIKD